MAKISKPLIIVLIFAFIAAFSLLHAGLPPTHDGEYHVIRFLEFDKVLRGGNLYPRWAPDLNSGYGIPLFSYNYPLPNYFASFLHIFSVTFIDAFKLNMFTAVLLSGLFFYLWTKLFFGRKGAVVGSVFYLFSPYLFVDVYIRGSVGEVWALALFPAFLWAATELFYKNKQKYLPVSVIFLGLIIFAHNILALMFFPFAVAYSLLLISFSKEKKSLIINLISLIVLGLGLSAIFWLPAILETKYTVGLQIFDYKNNFAEIYQLIFPSWGSGFFGGSLDNQMSIQIGLANLLALVLNIFVFYKLLKKRDKLWKLIGFFLLSFFLVVFFMLKISLPLWENLPLVNYFQFPWRFLSLAILICSFLAASLFRFFSSKFLAAGLIILAFILSIGYAHPAYFMQRNDNYYATRPNFIDGTDSIGNAFNTKWFDATTKRANSKIDLTTIKGRILKQQIFSTRYVFNLNMSSASNLVINTAYFPGWQAKIDNKTVIIGPTAKGLMRIYVPKGLHLLEIKFEDTPLRQAASMISLISLLALITLFIRKWYIRNNLKHKT